MANSGLLVGLPPKSCVLHETEDRGHRTKEKHMGTVQVRVGLDPFTQPSGMTLKGFFPRAGGGTHLITFPFEPWLWGSPASNA